MKSLFYLLTLVLFTIHGYCIDNIEQKTQQNPGIYLNFQDVPIFSEDNNPLSNMRLFNVILPLSLKDPEIQKKIQSVLERELGIIGEVIHLKDNDMRGFASGNILLIQMGNVIGWDENEMPICRISLQVETSVALNNTSVNTFLPVWSINTFFQELIDSSNHKMLKAVQKLVSDFVQNYKYVNKEQGKKPYFIFMIDLSIIGHCILLFLTRASFFLKYILSVKLLLF